LIAKSADDFIKFSERSRMYLQLDVEQLKGNNFWLAQINESIFERVQMQQLLADTRVSKKLFQESEERRLRQSLELEEIRLSFSLSACRGLPIPGTIEGTTVVYAAAIPVVDNVKCVTAPRIQVIPGMSQMACKVQHPIPEIWTASMAASPLRPMEVL